MTLIDNLRGSPGAKPTHPMQAPEVAAKLATAEGELSELEGQHGGVALDALAGVSGATERLAGINRQLATARERVATMKAAHKAALDRDEAAIRAQRAALQKTQIAAVRKHLEARDTAAVALSAAIVEATKQYHLLLDRSAKAQAACPIGTSWPGGTLCEPDPIRKLVEHELFRASASPGGHDSRDFPGAQLPGSEYEWQPAAVPPLADKIKAASQYVMTELTAKAPE